MVNISHFIPSKNKGISNSELKKGEQSKSGAGEGHGDAKTVSPYSNAQVQSAKDFIWDWMDDGNRQLIVRMATLPTHERHGLYVKQIFVEMEADQKDGLIVNERMIIGQKYSRQQSLFLQKDGNSHSSIAP